jgi:hypothetical protein
LDSRVTQWLGRAVKGATESSVQVNLNAVWEIDFWRRIRRLTDAARELNLRIYDGCPVACPPYVTALAEPYKHGKGESL